MATLFTLFRARLLPALLTAFGVVLITAGLLSYTTPMTEGIAVIETPEVIGASDDPTDDPLASVDASASPDATASTDPTVDPSASIDPTASPSPTRTPSGRETASRVVVPALNIDLPIVRGTDSYPYCNVAMFLSTSRSAKDDAFGQPSEDKVTYLYAHARDGMFGPIYKLAIVNRTPNKMLGMIVEVYTNYNRLYTYEVRQVRLHVTSLDAAIARNRQEVWLQTSEGPKGTPGKTQVLTRLLSVEQTTQRLAQPKPHPVNCG